MKNLTTLRNIILAILCSLVTVDSGAKTRSNGTLNLYFSVLNDRSALRNYTIQVFSEGKCLDSTIVKRSTDFHLSFELNKTYTIRICKNGFRERVILVDTHVPEKKAGVNFIYTFDLAMLNDDQAPNTLADLPVLLIEYDHSSRGFDYSKTYSGSIGHLPETHSRKKIHLHHQH